MTDSIQINPRIRPATKARLEEFRKERGHSQGDVVDAALEAYLAPTDGDTLTLLFQKVHAVEQGQKEMIALLSTVVDHLERQAHPTLPKVATREELYPELRAAEAVVPAAPAQPARPTRAAWWPFRGRGTP